MAEEGEFQFSDTGEENAMMKKYLALRNKCEQIQQGNEKLVNRLQHVKRLIRTYNRQRKFLQRRLDNYKDNYREAQVPVMWEEDQMYEMLKPHVVPVPLPTKESPGPSTSKIPKASRKVKTVKSHDQSTTANQLSASQSRDSMMSSSSVQSEAMMSRLSGLDSSPVKRPANAFMMFCDQYKQSIRNDYLREKKTVISQAELTKRLALKWNSLSPEDKKIYQDMFDIEQRSAQREAAGSYLSQDALESMYMESDSAVSSLLAGQGQL